MEKTRQERVCQQLTETNDLLSQSAVNAAKDLEREKLLVQSRYEGELDELRKRLRDGDAHMEKVRVHEQTQRLQLLDEASTEADDIFCRHKSLPFPLAAQFRARKD